MHGTTQYNAQRKVFYSLLAIPARELEFEDGSREVGLVGLGFPGIESGSPPDRLLAAEAYSLCGLVWFGI